MGLTSLLTCLYTRLNSKGLSSHCLLLRVEIIRCCPSFKLLTCGLVHGFVVLGRLLAQASRRRQQARRASIKVWTLNQISRSRSSARAIGPACRCSACWRPRRHAAFSEPIRTKRTDCLLSRTHREGWKQKEHRLRRPHTHKCWKKERNAVAGRAVRRSERGRRRCGGAARGRFKNVRHDGAVAGAGRCLHTSAAPGPHLLLPAVARRGSDDCFSKKNAGAAKYCLACGPPPRE